MTCWGFGYDELWSLWQVVVDRESYRVNKERLVTALSGALLNESQLRYIPINSLIPLFTRDIGDISELKQSIRESGVIEPLIARPSRQEGKFDIVCGFRRYEAARARDVGLSIVPCIVREISDEEAYKLNAIENNQRKEWNPIEEAEHYQDWRQRFHRSEDYIAQRIKKSQEYVSRQIKLLEAPEEIQNYLRQERYYKKRFTKTHALAILDNINDPQQQIYWTNRAIAKKWSSRKLENEIRRALQIPPEERTERPTPVCEWILKRCEKIRDIEEEIINYFREKGLSLHPLACRECEALSVCKMAEEEW